nr:uncharacterized protein LOC132432937 [Delphinus delphis]
MVPSDGQAIVGQGAAYPRPQHRCHTPPVIRGDLLPASSRPSVSQQVRCIASLRPPARRCCLDFHGQEDPRRRRMRVSCPPLPAGASYQAKQSRPSSQESWEGTVLALKDPHFLLHLHIVPQKGSSQHSPSLIPGTSIPCDPIPWNPHPLEPPSPGTSIPWDPIPWDPHPLGPPSPGTPSPGTPIPWDLHPLAPHPLAPCKSIQEGCPEAAASSPAGAQDAERDPRPTPTASPRAEPRDARSPADKVSVCA